MRCNSGRIQYSEKLAGLKEGKPNGEVRANLDEHTEGEVTDGYVEKKAEKVGDSIELGGIKHVILDIFQNEIMELGDETDWNFKIFNNFEVIDGDAPLDHHFYYSYSSSCRCTNSSNIEREWNILGNEFSDESERPRRPFFIRAYKGRKDLMRVAISVTEREVPFCHGLFFFDIKLPVDFPSKPPALFYRSYGRGLSPNLPRDGSVSLKHVYRTKCFSMLDLFLHMQGIVLDSGVDPNDLNSKQKFLVTCLTMMDMLNRPPMGFEDFVKGYFRKNAAAILQTFKEVMDLKDGDNKRLFFRLYNAFEENKAYCQYVLDSDLKQELKKLKEGENSDDFWMFDSSRKSSKSESVWSKFFF